MPAPSSFQCLDSREAAEVSPIARAPPQAFSAGEPGLAQGYDAAARMGITWGPS